MDKTFWSSGSWINELTRGPTIILSVMDDHKTHPKYAALTPWAVGVKLISLTTSWDLPSWFWPAEVGMWGGQMVNFSAFDFLQLLMSSLDCSR